MVYKGSADSVGEVSASSIDQNLSRLSSSLVVMAIVVACSCDVGDDMGLDKRNPSLDCRAVGPSPQIILSSTKYQ